MEYLVYVIYDKKVGEYNLPFYVRHPVQARRSFESTINTDGTVMHDYPEDYDLYCLGRYDVITGSFNLDDKPVFVCNGASLVIV